MVYRCHIGFHVLFWICRLLPANSFWKMFTEFQWWAGKYEILISITAALIQHQLWINWSDGNLGWAWTPFFTPLNLAPFQSLHGNVTVLTASSVLNVRQHCPYCKLYGGARTHASSTPAIDLWHSTGIEQSLKVISLYVQTVINICFCFGAHAKRGC